jgi:hypothetical protein
MDLLLMSLLLFAALWSSSVPSSVYLLQALAMLFKILRNTGIKRLWLLPALITSACLVVFKVVMVSLFSSGDSSAFFDDNRSTLEYLGVFLESQQSVADIVQTLLPDVLVLLCTIVDIYTPNLALFKKSPCLSLVTVTLVLSTGLTRCSVADLFYLLVAIAWVGCWSYKVFPSLYRGIAIGLSCLSYLRVALSYSLNIAGLSVSPALGLLEVRSSVLMVNLCLFYLQFAFLLYLYRPLLIPPVPLNESLLRPDLELSDIARPIESQEAQPEVLVPEDPHEETNFETVLNVIKDLFNSARLLLLVSRLLLFVWIVHYRSFVCLGLILWLYYSVLEVFPSNVVKSLLFTVVPVLVLMHVGCYLATTFHLHLDPYFGIIQFAEPIAELALQNIVIMSFLLTHRAYSNQTSTIRRQASKTPAGLVMTFVLQNSNKFTLSVVFVVGLSAINLLHTGLMIICIVFMTNTQLAKKRWELLVVYTMTILFLKYLWVLLIPFTAETDNNELIYQIVGLPYTAGDTKDIDGYIPQDYLVWLLLLSEVMQLVAYRAMKQRNSRQYREHMEAVQQQSKFFKCMSYVFGLVKTLHLWIVYVFILMVIMVSDLNLINFTRFLMLLCYLVIHIASADNSLEVGYYRVKSVWFIINIYSGVVLAARYVYQFAIYADTPDSPYMHIIGIDIFQTSELYEFMVGDCLILIATVLTSRIFSINFQERTRFARSSHTVEFDRATWASEPVISVQSLAIFTKMYGVISVPYNALLSFVVFCLATYWRLSASMGVAIAILCLYYYSLANWYVAHNRRKTPYLTSRPKWNMRFRCWLSLFILAILCFTLEYFCAFISDTLLTKSAYHSALWYMAVLGFARSDSLLLFNVYGYFIMLLLLIAERHCLEHLKATRDVEQSIEEPVADSKYRGAIRVICEESICMMILLLAFFKLTFVSIVYVVAVIGSKLLEDSIRSTKLLSNTLSVMILLQYGLIYSNSNNDNTPATQAIPDAYAPFHLPWYDSLPLSKDTVTFLSLGSGFSQESNIFLDALILIYVNLYFLYLGRRTQPTVNQIESEEERQSNSRLEKTRDIIYSSAHYVILVMVLIFVVQSTGLLSVIYLAFCLFCLAKINYSIKSERSLKTFAKVIKWTLVSLMVDFLMVVLFQMPLPWIHASSSPNWQDIIGLKCLWSCGKDSAPADSAEYYDKVTYRIITYSLLWVLYRMLWGDDYIQYRSVQMLELNARSASLCLQLTEKFNDDRICLNQTYEAERLDLEHKLEQIDLIVKSWERKARLTHYKRSEESSGSDEESKVSSRRRQGAEGRSHESSYKETEGSIKATPSTPFKTKVVQWFVEHVNPILFQEFLRKIQPPIESESAELRLGKFDYLYLLYSSIISNTQSITVFFLLLNHFIYASLESLVFPLVVLCYVLLENPRPLPQVWRNLLVYTEGVVLAKYIMQLEVWKYLDSGSHLENYRDQGKLGYNLAENTYSESIFAYIVWDILVLFALIMHRHFLIVTGLDRYSEFQIESLHEGKLRRLYTSNELAAAFDRFSFDSVYDANEVSVWRRVKLFFIRLLPIYKEEKPGQDYYTYILWCQIAILVFLFCFYTKMNGQDTNISSSFS